eukprot:scaffold602_cov298-Pinguiococcus_pyrenoidosus.AAC.46
MKGQAQPAIVVSAEVTWATPIRDSSSGAGAKPLEHGRRAAVRDAARRLHLGGEELRVHPARHRPAAVDGGHRAAGPGEEELRLADAGGLPESAGRRLVRADLSAGHAESKKVAPVEVRGLQAEHREAGSDHSRVDRPSGRHVDQPGVQADREGAPAHPPPGASGAGGRHDAGTQRDVRSAADEDGRGDPEHDGGG